MSLRRINFTSVPVDDQDRAIGFYRDTLGFTLQVDAPYEEGWRWVFLSVPGHDTRLQFARRSEMDLPRNRPCLALVVEDVDGYCDCLREAGVEIVDGPADAPWAAPGVRYATIRDSEGNMVLLESLAA